MGKNDLLTFSHSGGWGEGWLATHTGIAARDLSAINTDETFHVAR